MMPTDALSAWVFKASSEASRIVHGTLDDLLLCVIKDAVGPRSSGENGPRTLNSPEKE